MTEHPKITRVEVYQDHGKEFRFRALAANGATITVSSESYQNHGDALGAATSLFPDAQLVDETQEAAT